MHSWNPQSIRNMFPKGQFSFTRISNVRPYKRGRFHYLYISSIRSCTLDPVDHAMHQVHTQCLAVTPCPPPVRGNQFRRTEFVRAPIQLQMALNCIPD